MGAFFGREVYLRQLSTYLQEVQATGTGRLLSIRGRRRVGKSRLIEEWLQRARVPHVFFAASRQAPQREVALFAEEVARSSLPSAAIVASGVTFESWDAAFTLIATTAAATATPASPITVVLDEFPYLLEQDPSVEAAIQKVWDRFLQRAPVMILLVGSDLSMMTALTEYGHPLYGRTTEMVVSPFSATETASMLGVSGADALDSYLVVGGFPLIVQSWKKRLTLWQYLRQELANPTSPLIVTGERMLAAEFPAETQARDVLDVIGAGETTFGAISSGAGIQHLSLSRSLDVLVNRKRVVAATRPLCSRPSKETRYTVADPYLRFWLRFIQPGLEEVERGRGDIVIARIKEQWSTYRGKAIEPLIREAVERLLPDQRFGDARYVGGYWTRTNDVEVDLIGARERVAAKRIAFVGSIKWKERAPFGIQDLRALAGQRPKVPGTDDRTRLVGVSRSGFDTPGLDVALTPDDLLDAWKT
ncbi:MAG: ATP-binding protein [Chloroflexota bacterium]